LKTRRALSIPHVERGACVTLDTWAYDDTRRINKGQTPIETTSKKSRHGLAGDPRAGQVPMQLTPGSGAQFLDCLTNATYQLDTPVQRSWRRRRGIEQPAKDDARRKLKEGDAPAANDRSRAPSSPASVSSQLASRSGTSLYGCAGRPTRTEWNAKEL
jgi:hypothetical protein